MPVSPNNFYEDIFIEQGRRSNRVAMFKGAFYATINGEFWKFDPDLADILSTPLGQLANTALENPVSGPWRKIPQLPEGLELHRGMLRIKDD